VACLLWLSLAIIGRGLTRDVYSQGPGLFPSAAQLDFYVLVPVASLVTVALCAWLVNGLQRWFDLLALLSGIALVALLPYMLLYTGGV